MKATLHIRVDEDYLRLVAYRHVLREIVAGHRNWTMDGSDAAEYAQAALEHFGDMRADSEGSEG